MHQCGPNCSCRKDFNLAVGALVEASQLLSDSIAASSDLMIENCWARVRAAKARVQATRALYMEHRCGNPRPMTHTLVRDEQTGTGNQSLHVPATRGA